MKNPRTALPRVIALAVLAFLLWQTTHNLVTWYNGLTGITRIPYTLVAVIVFEIALTALLCILLFRPALLAFLQPLQDRLHLLRWPLAILTPLAAEWFLLWESSQVFLPAYTRTTLLIAVWLFMTWLLSEEKPLTWKGALAALTVYGTLTWLSFRLYQTSSYPFSLHWSEGNRLWDYSILFGRDRYNFPADQSIYSLTDVGRQLVWGLPFLLPDPSIRLVRIWDVIVFSLPYMFLGWAVFSAEARRKPGVFVLLGLAAFLFLQQGPIYTPLILAALLVALTKRAPLWLAVPAVMLASYFANISRFTWTFAPGMYAVMWAFLDQDFEKVKGLIPRWGRAVVLGVSAIFGGLILSKLIDIVFNTGVSNLDRISAAGIQESTSQHPLIWARLFPNPTYPTGILLALVLAAAPLAVLVVWLVVSGRWRLHFWQKLTGAGFLLAFLAVGIVISTKAGGGNNLHNLDMFLIGVLFAAGLAWENGLRNLIVERSKRPLWFNLTLLLVLLVPAWQIGQMVNPQASPDPDEVLGAISTVRNAVNEARAQGDVLFIDQRQLITFGKVGDVPLVVDYEKKVLMNQAMEGDAEYFAEYYQDLADKRFSLIVSEPLTIKFTAGDDDFGLENDSWVAWVTIPTKCYYDTLYRSDEVRMELLVPRDQPLEKIGEYDCPDFR